MNFLFPRLWSDQFVGFSDWPGSTTTLLWLTSNILGNGSNR
jgi:hypothetical protein